MPQDYQNPLQDQNLLDWRLRELRPILTDVKRQGLSDHLELNLTLEGNSFLY